MTIVSSSANSKSLSRLFVPSPFSLWLDRVKLNHRYPYDMTRFLFLSVLYPLYLIHVPSQKTLDYVSSSLQRFNFSKCSSSERGKVTQEAHRTNLVSHSRMIYNLCFKHNESKVIRSTISQAFDKCRLP